MRKTLQLPTAAVLSARLNYDPISGKLFWKHAPRECFSSERAWKLFNSRDAGKEAGCNHLQRGGKPHAITVGFAIGGKYRSFVAHRIIYALMGIDIPAGMQIDHKDRNPWNNSWDNLRLATESQNLCNQESKKRRCANGMGLPKGVSYERGRYKSQLQVNGKKVYSGSFGTPEEAAKAYNEAARRHHGDFAFINPINGLS